MFFSKPNNYDKRRWRNDIHIKLTFTSTTNKQRKVRIGTNRYFKIIIFRSTNEPAIQGLKNDNNEVFS
jgi:hypothetical protein